MRLAESVSKWLGRDCSLSTETCQLPFSFKILGFSNTEEDKYRNARVPIVTFKHRSYESGTPSGLTFLNLACRLSFFE